jgi:LysR family glycine cleavage system transcriptional activator
MSTWQDLPALRTLRVFEVAARHLNYTRAGAELHLTHGAVSHQIHALEESLGTRLFERVGRGMRLTEAGHQLALGVRETVDALAAVIGRVRERESGDGLTISVLPSFASAWLVGRLGSFLDQNPAIQLNLRSTTVLANFRNDRIDAAIRYGKGPWPDTITEKLRDDELFPVMSPGFRRGRLPRTPAELAKAPLLHVGAHPWSQWFAAAGAPAPEQRGSYFDDSELALQSAMQGHGVVLGRASLVSARLREGSLVAPFALRIPSPFAYFLVYPASSAAKPAFQRFREWLLAEIARG